MSTDRADSIAGGGTGEPAIPNGPEAVDATWLTSALEAGGVARGATVVDVESDGDIGTGQAARSIRLRLTWDDTEGRPASVVGKFPSADPDTREFLFLQGTYVKEWVFYDRLAPTVDVRAPECYVSRYDGEAKSFILVMEDLSRCQQGDQLVGSTVDQVALALEQAVKLHAPRYGDASIEAVLAEGQLVRSDAEAGEFAQPVYAGALPAFLEVAGDRIGDDERRLLHDMAPLVATWFRGPEGGRTLVHRDFRGDNLLFGTTPDDPPVVVLDYQTVTYGPVGCDLAYLIAGSIADPAERAVVERGLVEEYRAGMAAAGVELSADALWDDYRFGSLWGVLMMVMASMGAQRTERGDEMFPTLVARHARQAIELDALSLLT